ncbi:MAG TPA: hypothetical protein VFP72_18895 [Kineosporiaceae bacterium]|nr:hypothetical protein [Kineosporiaceae bacterium]
MGDDLVAGGVPVVAHWFGGGLLQWCDGADAVAMWRRSRARVIVQPLPPRVGQEPWWTLGRWESPVGQPLLVLTGHC